jgi:uncharacterized protein (TIGR02453 family)
MAGTTYFTRKSFTFLKDLAENNNREWFNENKARYEDDLKSPALHFIADFAPHLKKISPHFRADPRGNGGSLFRIYRDTRFSKDKRPYKTYTGLQFRHDEGKDAHCPGFYLHLEPGAFFVGAGIWHPDGPTTRAIREAIVEDPAGWKRASRGKKFAGTYVLQGDRLKRHPRGFDEDHPLIEDLKWKDFIGVTKVTQKTITGDDFMKEFTALCKAGAPYMKFLCKAVDVPF